jgi:DNA modification methylase
MEYKVEEIMDKAKLFRGDNLQCLRSLEENSVDSVVTDPPYGLSFMGKKWDHDVPSVEFWKEVYRVLKPGGHVLSFGGTRTYHRMTVNIEDAGFEIRDQIMWIYGSGFPKSHNIGKAVDKINGNERKVIGTIQSHDIRNGGLLNSLTEKRVPISLEITEGSSEFEGWGTALKPANEPIVLARKPLGAKTIAENVLKYGTGGLNIEKSKIGKDLMTPHGFGDTGFVANNSFSTSHNFGRFPSNVIVDDTIIQSLGEQGKFFYSPKVSKKERNLGLELLNPCKIEGRDKGQDSSNLPDKVSTIERKNIHPTVKPIDLMRYLIKLVTPKNGVVFDPFMGSGSTGVGTLIEGFKFIGMEMENEYFEIAKQRIQYFEEYIEMLDLKRKKQTSNKNTIESSIDERNLGIWANRGLKKVS